ncbi:MAG: indolepyruvate oxidoreductase subunit beta [Ignisphaera sp.]|uniref:Indolepyruvate ferredoxin oxidoreductase subunit beta n=1 Tax=Ignisphaera aggregans TaxID=334771 RepID=A0A7C4NL49_9CREN
MKLEILISGVGGQGVITFGSMLGELCVKRGINVVTAETHGMAQRMGSVEMFVRIGNVKAPLIPPGSADYVVALEMIESLRAVKYLKKCCWMLLSDIYLPPVGSGKPPSRTDILSALSDLPINFIVVEVEDIIKRLKDSRVTNMVMLGALLAFEDISKIIPVEEAEDLIHRELGDVNREALVLGYKQVKEKLADEKNVYRSRYCQKIECGSK